MVGVFGGVGSSEVEAFLVQDVALSSLLVPVQPDALLVVQAFVCETNHLDE